MNMFLRFLKEKGKLISSVIMFGLIIFGYSTARSIKDSIINIKMGSYCIPFIKFNIVTPFIIFIAVPLCRKLISKVGVRKIIYIPSLLINLYFFIYYFFHNLDTWLPQSVFNYFFNLIKYYEVTQNSSILGSIVVIFSDMMIHIHHVGIYLFSEIWGTIILSYIFWLFINNYSDIKYAKSDYALIPSLANFGTIASGFFINYSKSIDNAIICFVVNVFVTLIFYSFVLVPVFNAVELDNLENKEKININDSKQKNVNKIIDGNILNRFYINVCNFFTSIIDEFNFIWNNTVVFNQIINVVSYGIIINLIEILWKSTATKYGGSVSGFMAIQGLNSVSVGIASMLLAFSSRIMLKHKWFHVAIVSPFLVGITGSLFLISYFFGNSLFLDQALRFMVYFGLINNVCSKVSKYSFFDPAKECCYLALDSDTRKRAKSIDAMGGRIGKSGGSLIFCISILLLVPTCDLASAALSKNRVSTGLNTLSLVAPYVTLFMLLTFTVWIRALFNLKPIMEKNFDSKDNNDDTTNKNKDNIKVDNTQKSSDNLKKNK